MKKITITGCPADLDERTELYCLNRLSVGDAIRFEAHLAVCPPCLYEAMETDVFVKSLVGALRELEEEESIAESVVEKGKRAGAGLRKGEECVRVVCREEWILTAGKNRATSSLLQTEKVGMEKVARQLRRG